MHVCFDYGVKQMNILELSDDLLDVILCDIDMPHCKLVNKRFAKIKHKFDVANWAHVIISDNTQLLDMYWDVYQDFAGDMMHDLETSKKQFMNDFVPEFSLLREYPFVVSSLVEICFDCSSFLVHPNRLNMLILAIVWPFCCDNSVMFNWSINKMNLSIYARQQLLSLAVKHDRPHIGHLLNDNCDRLKNEQQQMIMLKHSSLTHDFIQKPRQENIEK